jgi:predicted nucleotidyltransferase
MVKEINMKTAIPINLERVTAFCCKWKIAEFSLFGSVLRSDFRPESDVDILVNFTPEADWSLLDRVEMVDELKTIFGRDVDLVEEAGLRNPYRRRSILAGKEVLYAA